jgi:hypothetical protein
MLNILHSLNSLYNLKDLKKQKKLNIKLAVPTKSEALELIP